MALEWRLLEGGRVAIIAAHPGDDVIGADPAIINFHRETAAAFMREGVLRLYVMKINGLAAAALYGFACQLRTFAYLSGFAPEALG